MHHYVYYSYEEWGRGYIGVRSCHCSPENDCKYFGSFYDKTFKPTNKIVLTEFSDREEALAAEIKLHDFYQVHKNPHFANKTKQTSTKFAGPGGFDICVKRNPDFFSEAGKIGGLVTYSKYPEMYSDNGKKGYEKGIKVYRVNNPNWVEEFAEHRMKGAAYFQNNPEAAKKRAINGCKAMQEYWKTHERSASVKQPVKVTLPSGEELFFASKSEAARQLNVPPTTWKRILNGQIRPKSKWAGYSVIRTDTIDSEGYDGSYRRNMKYIHYIGLPGAGKTTLMWAKLDELRDNEEDQFVKEGLVKYHKFENQKVIIFGEYVEGKIFSGLDATSKAIGPKFREWVNANKEKYSGWLLMSEGERFSNSVMLDYLFEHTDMELVCLQVSQEELNKRRAARNNTQSESWMRGMETRITNLCKAYPHKIQTVG